MHNGDKPVYALDCAVPQVPLASVLPFLEGAMRAAGERRRNASVIKSLRKAENLQCREAAIRSAAEVCGLCVAVPQRPWQYGRSGLALQTTTC